MASFFVSFLPLLLLTGFAVHKFATGLGHVLVIGEGMVFV